MNESQVFTNALKLATPAERAAYLDEVCAGNPQLRADLEGLLQAHANDPGFLEQPLGPLGEAGDGWQAPGTPIDPQAAGFTPAEGPGFVLAGRYKLLQQIGEGGMGTVFMAEQTQPVQRKVAVKVIKAGMGSRHVLARFEAERQALALMDHVNIARVIDGGATDAGLPYFVMELVHGVPITKYCDDNRLTPRQRLELFVPVCQAIQHAHQKGIIHRDIKPSNVLVALYDGKPVPKKVIDFGVAKATEQRLTERTLFTHYGTLVGTLEYMSPEQAEMSALGVDTRSDIYSLGVLLYELLTGSPPLSHQRLRDAAYADALRMIKEEEPPRPSTRLSDSGAALASISAQRHMEPDQLTKLMKGELDWIVMKTLEKDRNRRYDTANDFALDVQRYLADEPVQAYPPSAWYRFRKVARRNKGAFAAALAAALAMLLAVVGLAVSNVLISQQKNEKLAALDQAKANEEAADQQRWEAQENLKDALAAVDQMLTRVADERLLYVPKMEPVRRELLEEALKFYLKFLEKKSADPVIRREAALVYGRVGKIQHFLGQYAEAEKAYRTGIGMLEELVLASPLDPALWVELWQIHLQFYDPLSVLGKGEEALTNIRRAVEIAEKLVEDFPDVPAHRFQLVAASNYLASALTARQPDEAEKILRRNLMVADSAYLLQDTYRHLGGVFLTTRRFPKAEEAYRQALKYAEKMVAEGPAANDWARSAVALHLGGLAGVLAATQNPREAEEHLLRAILIWDKLATDHPASPRYRHHLAVAHIEHAGVLKKLDRTAEAEEAYHRAVDLYEKLGTDFPTIPAFLQLAFDQRLGLGQFLVEAGRAQEAQQVYGEASALSPKLPADFSARLLVHWRGLVRSHIGLGRLLETAGRTEEAEAAFRQALAIQEKLRADYGGKPEYRREVARSHAETAWQLRLSNRHSEAEKLYRWALEHFVKLANESPQSQQAQEDLALTQFSLADHYRWVPGRLADAEKGFRQALELYEKLSADFPDVPGYRITLADCRERLASVFLFQGRLQEAEQALKEALALAERLAEQHPADRTVRMTLAMGARHWGETLWRMGRPQEAEPAFRSAEAILEKLLADFPQDSWYRLERGITCRMLVALLARDLKQPQAAEEFYRRAVAIFEKLATEFPRDLSYRWRLADAHREWAFCLQDIGRTQEAKGIFDRAIANLSEAVEMGSKDILGVWYPLALLHLSTGRTREYRALCETLLERFGQASVPDYWVVIICKLAPDAVADLARPVQLAEQMLARDPHDPEFVGVLGDTLYRKGDLEAAVQRLEASIRAAPGVGVHWRKLFLAMAYHRLGRPAKAQQLLQEAVQWIEKNGQGELGEGAELKEPLPWSNRLDLQLLRQEAEELLAKKSGQ